MSQYRNNMQTPYHMNGRQEEGVSEVYYGKGCLVEQSDSNVVERPNDQPHAAYTNVVRIQVECCCDG